MELEYGEFKVKGFSMNELPEVVRAVQGKPVTPEPEVAAVVPLKSVPALAPAEEKKKSWIGSKKSRPWLPTPSRDSLYYTVERSKNHALLAQLYDYVESFPDGVTAKQCAAVFRNSVANVQTQLASLGKDNLVMTIDGRRCGKVYRATYPNGLAAEVENAMAGDAAECAGSAS